MVTTASVYICSLLRAGPVSACGSTEEVFLHPLAAMMPVRC